jgi:hypothetical protein
MSPVTAQSMSSMAPYMVPNTFAKLRAAMMQQPAMQAPQTAPPPELGYGGGMGYGG